MISIFNNSYEIKVENCPFIFHVSYLGYAYENFGSADVVVPLQSDFSQTASNF